MTVPTNNEEAEARNLLKYAVGFDHPTFGQGFFFTQDAVDSLISDVHGPAVTNSEGQEAIDIAADVLRGYGHDAIADAILAARRLPVSVDNDREEAAVSAFPESDKEVYPAAVVALARDAFRKGWDAHASQPREVRTPSRDELARAYDPEAFQEHPIEQRSKVAAIQWGSRRFMAIEAADRVLASSTTPSILTAVLSWACDDEGNMPDGLREVLAPWLPVTPSTPNQTGAEQWRSR